MLSMSTSVLRVCSACASLRPEHTRKEVKFFNNFLSTSKMKNFIKSLLMLTNGLKSSTEKKIFGPNLKKNLLKNRLSSEHTRKELCTPK
jgi:hypothetical protein